MKTTQSITDSEERIQAQCFQWFWNTYPQYRGLLCYNLNNSQDAKHGHKNQQLGLIPGRSDMALYLFGKAYMIEFKKELGRQSPSQREWEELVLHHGFTYVIVRSLSEFQQYIWEVLLTANRTSAL
jgi:hypothetical protein